MSDATALRQALSRLDNTAPAIQRAAGAMMKHYDRSAAVAVTEWRNSLQAAQRTDQLLSLLYVANEVLQISKRNRGNKFLEAMSPVLGQALLHICQKDPSVTEKVRRTVKIWGDRQVFSVRFVGQLLSGLEPYRHGSAPPPSAAAATASTSRRHSSSTTSGDKATFSPTTEEINEEKNNNEIQPKEKDDDDDIMQILEGDENNPIDADDDDDDDEDVFASSGTQKLNLDIDLDSTAVTDSATTPSKKDAAKRRRGSTGSQGSSSSFNNGTSTSNTNNNSKKRRRKSVLSMNSFLDMWNRLSALQQSFEHSQLALGKIQTALSKISEQELEYLVGDELQAKHKEVNGYQDELQSQKQQLHTIASERKSIEQEALRYLNWLEKALQQDQNDIDFCAQLEMKLVSFKKIHGGIRRARDLRVAEENKRREEEEERERKRREAEENERFRKAALARETEAKPGMVWNPTTREYQALNTDESWRD